MINFFLTKIKISSINFRPITIGRFFDLTTLKPIYRAIKVENGTGPVICVPGLSGQIIGHVIGKG